MFLIMFEQMVGATSLRLQRNDLAISALESITVLGQAS